MKLYVTIGATVGGIVGVYIGNLLDGTGFGLWSIALSTLGGIAGIWAGYRAGQYFTE